MIVKECLTLALAYNGINWFIQAQGLMSVTLNNAIRSLIKNQI